MPRDKKVLDLPAAPRPSEVKQAKVQLQKDFAIGLDELLSSFGIPVRGRSPLLANLTHRRRQATHRWLRPVARGGLPDLLSFKLLTEAFQADANFLLGLANRSFKGRRGIIPEALDEFTHELIAQTPKAQFMRLSGHEMEPTIKDGALLIIDPTIETVQGNGIYLLDYKGRRLVRTVEERLGEGYALKCENPRYDDVLVQATAEGAFKTLRVLGRVKGWMQVMWD